MSEYVEELIKEISNQIVIENDANLISNVKPLTPVQLKQLAEIESKLDTIGSPRLDLVVVKWLALHQIKQYSFNPDLSIDTFESVVLSGHSLTNLDVQFKRIGGVGNFFVARNYLSSFRGFPSYLNGNLYADNNQFTSLKDIHKTIKHVNMSNCITPGVHAGLIDFIGNPIESHVLGLCLIKGVKFVKLTDEKITLNWGFEPTAHQISNSAAVEKDIIDTMSKNILDEIDASIVKDIISMSNKMSMICSPPKNEIDLDTDLLEKIKKKSKLWLEEDNLDLEEKRKAELFAAKKARRNFNNKHLHPSIPAELVHKLKAVQDIVNKHLDDVILCQNALIDAGFSEYARL